MAAGVVESHAEPGAAPLDEALACPLCGYDLRGLPAGRCPECGHAFDPAALRAAAGARHPYLFEHRHGSGLRRFLRTLFAGWRPRRFWTLLRPGMPIVPRRLAAYAIMAALIGIAGASAGFVSDVVQQTRTNLRLRETSGAYYRLMSPADRQRLDRSMPGGNYIAVVHRGTPLPTEAAFWRGFPWRSGMLRGFPLALLVIAWPAVTFASLMVFRRTMRQARIRRGHVARAVLYSGDVFAFTLPALLLSGGLAKVGIDPVGWLLDLSPRGLGIRLLLPGTDDILLAAAVLLMLLAAWRLWRAYRHYLSFPHAAATVVASQIIVWLAILAIGGPLLEILSEVL